MLQVLIRTQSGRRNNQINLTTYIKRNQRILYETITVKIKHKNNILFEHYIVHPSGRIIILAIIERVHNTMQKRT